jgi:hypothetical protein
MHYRDNAFMCVLHCSRQLMEVNEMVIKSMYMRRQFLT